MRAEAANLPTMALQTSSLKKYPGWELELCDVDIRIFSFPFLPSCQKEKDVGNFFNFRKIESMLSKK